MNNNTLNINFSVALYDTLFIFMNTLKEESQLYEKSKSSQNVLGGNNMSKEMNFNPSLYFIKNSTGELLLFKTAKQPIFTEL